MMRRVILTSHTMRRLAATVLLSTLAGVGWADEPIDETMPATADGRVLISNLSGSVTVTGWDREEISVQGTLGQGTERLDFDVKDDRARIKVIIPKRARNVDGSELEIKLPRGSRVEVETVSADIDISEVTGLLELESVSGEILIEGAPEEIQAESVSGNVEINAQTSRIQAASVSGDVEVEGARGELDAQSVSGDVQILGNDFEEIRAQTVSGTVIFEGALSGRGRFEFESHSGDVELELVGDISAEFEVSTFSGDIENTFGRRAERTSKYTPGSELLFTLGDGEAQVTVSTFSGDVEISEAR